MQCPRCESKSIRRSRRNLMERVLLFFCFPTVVEAVKLDSIDCVFSPADPEPRQEISRNEDNRRNTAVHSGSFD